MIATLEHVRRSFGERAAVENCNLELEPGRVTAMIGPSGCGKSTISFLLAGYTAPDEGGPSPERLLVFQDSALMPWLTTLDNITFGPRARGEPRRDAELARALINDPPVMILDEPFHGLDALTRRLIQECCAALLEDSLRTTTLLITTDVDEAIFLAGRLLIIADRPTRVRHALEIRQGSVIVSQMLAGKQQFGYMSDMAQP